MDGTKIVPNHVENEYDVRWSFLVKCAAWIAGIVAAILAASVAAAAVASVALAFTTVRKLDVIEYKQSEIIRNQSALRVDLQSLTKTVSEEDYLTRTEFKSWLDSTERALSVRAAAAEVLKREGRK